MCGTPYTASSLRAYRRLEPGRFNYSYQPVQTQLQRQFGNAVQDLRWLKAHHTLCHFEITSSPSILEMVKRTSVFLTTLSVFASLVAAQEDVVTLYVPSLRPAAPSQPPKDINQISDDEVLNDMFHLGGKIDGISAIGVGGADATWYVGVHQYSVVVTRTANQLSTVTLPTPISKSVTFLVHPTDLVYLGGKVDVKFGADRDQSGELQYECSHDVDDDKNVPVEEGIVLCRKIYSTATPPITLPVGESGILTATTVGHAVAIATITNDPNLTLPTLVRLGASFSTYVAPPPVASDSGDIGSGIEVRVGWFGFIASVVVLLVYSFL
ncbi:hypothetical protein BKA70DRAFT_381785 [Coprinopsis sp. MPI-PUGE-AT-0042]|nr:hypothetical protein BKA70DRAFT_381785 [Coprinopsis sp. MPI-PUGE-AT-0042]